MTTFGDRLRYLRTKNGVSVSYLAASTCVNRSSIYRWEHGKAIPKSPEIISLLSNFFHVPSDYFFNSEPPHDIDIRSEIRQIREEINSLRQLIKKTD